MRRSGRSIAAIAAGTVLAVVGGVGVFAGWTQATADIEDPDAPIATAPPTFPDISAAPAQEIQAEVEAMRTPTPPVAVEYAQLSAAAISSATAPALRQAEEIAWRYQPQIAFDGGEPTFGGQRSGVEMSLERPRRGRADRREGGGRLAAFSDRVRKPKDYHHKGRWYLFASDESTAVGLNLLRNRTGELRRMSWSAEKVAAIGDLQAGVGWRKGAFQAALSLVDREVSIYGRSRDERFVAFTISIRPRSKASGPRRHPSEEPSYYPPRARPR